MATTTETEPKKLSPAQHKKLQKKITSPSQELRFSLREYRNIAKKEKHPDFDQWYAGTLKIYVAHYDKLTKEFF